MSLSLFFSLKCPTYYCKSYNFTESTVLSLRDLEKPLHHILGVISNPIMIELIRDVLFGAFDLGRCHLSKAKFDIPNSQRAKGGGKQVPFNTTFRFFEKKKTETNMSSKYLKKRQFKPRTRFPKKKERNSRHGRYFNLIPRQLFKVIKRFPYFLRQQICCFLPRT